MRRQIDNADTLTLLCVFACAYCQHYYHYNHLFNQVKLAGQQAQDLVGRVQTLLCQKDDIEKCSTRQLRSHLARTRAVRKRVQAKMQQLKAQMRYVSSRTKRTSDAVHLRMSDVQQLQLLLQSC
jgi:hypothetical protein